MGAKNGGIFGELGANFIELQSWVEGLIFLFRTFFSCLCKQTIVILSYFIAPIKLFFLCL